MKDELIEPFAAPEFFVDGFEEREIKDGIYTCSAYRMVRGVPVVQFRLVMRVGDAFHGMEQTAEVFRTARLSESKLVTEFKLITH